MLGSLFHCLTFFVNILHQLKSLNTAGSKNKLYYYRIFDTKEVWHMFITKFNSTNTLKFPQFITLTRSDHSIQKRSNNGIKILASFTQRALNIVLKRICADINVVCWARIYSVSYMRTFALLRVKCAFSVLPPPIRFATPASFQWGNLSTLSLYHHQSVFSFFCSFHWEKFLALSVRNHCIFRACFGWKKGGSFSMGKSLLLSLCNTCIF